MGGGGNNVRYYVESVLLQGRGDPVLHGQGEGRELEGGDRLQRGHEGRGGQPDQESSDV